MRNKVDVIWDIGNGVVVGCVILFHIAVIVYSLYLVGMVLGWGITEWLM